MKNKWLLKLSQSGHDSGLDSRGQLLGVSLWRQPLEGGVHLSNLAVPKGGEPAGRWVRTGSESGGEALPSDPRVCVIGNPGLAWVRGQVRSAALIPGCLLPSCLLPSSGV